MRIQYTSQIATKPFLTGEGIHWLEKEDTGRVTLEDIKDALEEFKRLFQAGFASKAEILTLSRAFPDNPVYLEAAGQQDDDDPMVVGGPASVELIDREGHLITTDALKKAFDKFMENFRTRNAMVLHSDVQVGWALPAYISKGGQIFKSGVDDKGLFFICELRGDTKISDKVKEQINSGRLKSYSIAGSATKVQNMQKGTMPYMQVDEMELAEVTVCEKGVNQGATFELLKAEVPQTGKIDKDQCGYRDASPAENQMGINCGHCAYYNAGEKTCDLVAGDIQPNDYCKVFAPCESGDDSKKVVIVMQNKDKVDFKKSFDSWMYKEKKEKDPLKSGESFATLHNFAGREAEHHQLLREYGFPSEQPSESSRYVPVVETETDDNGIPKNIKPPWVVNEAGQELGDKHDEDSPDYNKSAKAKARKSAGALQNMSNLFLNKEDDEDIEKWNPLATAAVAGRAGKKIGQWATSDKGKETIGRVGRGVASRLSPLSSIIGSAAKRAAPAKRDIGTSQGVQAMLKDDINKAKKETAISRDDPRRARGAHLAYGHTGGSLGSRMPLRVTPQRESPVTIIKPEASEQSTVKPKEQSSQSARGQYLSSPQIRPKLSSADKRAQELAQTAKRNRAFTNPNQGERKKGFQNSLLKAFGLDKDDDYIPSTTPRTKERGIRTEANLPWSSGAYGASSPVPQPETGMASTPKATRGPSPIVPSSLRPSTQGPFDPAGRRPKANAPPIDDSQIPDDPKLIERTRSKLSSQRQQELDSIPEGSRWEGEVGTASERAYGERGGHLPWQLTDEEIDDMGLSEEEVERYEAHEAAKYRRRQELTPVQNALLQLSHKPKKDDKDELPRGVTDGENAVDKLLKFMDDEDIEKWNPSRKKLLDFNNKYWTGRPTQAAKKWMSSDKGQKTIGAAKKTLRGAADTGFIRAPFSTFRGRSKKPQGFKGDIGTVSPENRSSIISMLKDEDIEKFTPAVRDAVRGVKAGISNLNPFSDFNRRKEHHFEDMRENRRREKFNLDSPNFIGPKPFIGPRKAPKPPKNWPGGTMFGETPKQAMLKDGSQDVPAQGRMAERITKDANERRQRATDYQATQDRIKANQPPLGPNAPHSGEGAAPATADALAQAGSLFAQRGSKTPDANPVVNTNDHVPNPFSIYGQGPGAETMTQRKKKAFQNALLKLSKVADGDDDYWKYTDRDYEQDVAEERRANLAHNFRANPAVDVREDATHQGQDYLVDGGSKREAAQMANREKGSTLWPDASGPLTPAEQMQADAEVKRDTLTSSKRGIGARPISASMEKALLKLMKDGGK